MSIAVIDVAPFLSGDARQRHAVAQEIADSCEKTGFFCIRGHGVASELIARTREVVGEFFALPDAEKRRVLRDEQRPVRGFFPCSTQSGQVGKSPDLHECFAMGPPDIPRGEQFETKEAQYFFADNLYPDKPEGFRDTVTAYFNAIQGLADQLMRVMALALEHDEEYFSERVSHPACVMRMIHYPAQETDMADGRVRFHAHTDYGTLTILRGDNVPGGLQIKLPDQGWVDVHAPDDAFICNLGDTMARWTHGRWSSTFHRVTNPPPEARHHSRISLAFFHQPNYDVLLKEIANTRWSKR